MKGLWVRAGAAMAPGGSRRANSNLKVVGTACARALLPSETEYADALGFPRFASCADFDGHLARKLLNNEIMEPRTLFVQGYRCLDLRKGRHMFRRYLFNSRYFVARRFAISQGVELARKLFLDVMSLSKVICDIRWSLWSRSDD